MVCICCFFFFKQKTAYEMRISDWSSDVCSSDLLRSLSRCVCGRGALFLHGRGNEEPVAGHWSLQRFILALSFGHIDWRRGHGRDALSHPPMECAVRSYLAGDRGHFHGAQLFRSASRSEEHTSEHKSLMRTSTAVF